MIADAIKFVLTNLPAFLCLAAVVIPMFVKRGTPWPDRYLGWVLLLAVGLDGIWAGLFHVFFPALASAQIGWQPSPYEFEVGVADISYGVVAVLAFWRSLAFKTAIGLFAVLYYSGVSVGHFVQAYANGDTSPDNFGLLLILTIARVIVLMVLLALANRGGSKRWRVPIWA
ncbi:hypothetical protein SAMN05428969_3006 [Devosia sp. YR412]|uniref:DUF6790 family protein n=1 Tax=Devosia sp. YR412 TaxID=1881030 RepID=UPI0008D42E49|nr:DUF6790 family protein [Devosia sp. YR412]SEQ41809.1 hypothetical protein SAMN05428969_3006 [Devosia sp. YR412]